MIWIFWISAFAFATPFLFYPVGVFLLSRLRRKPAIGSATPSATLVVSAFNEAGCIRDKIANALALDYPSHLFDVMVISDASDDGTDEIVEGWNDPRVKLCRMERRSGKSAGLTRFCPRASGDILVFTDANSIFQPDALTKLARHFDDFDLGYSVGRQSYTNIDSSSSDSENIYWSIELMMKAWESRLSSVVGADGAIYALRSELFEPLSAEDINDFLLPLKVVVRGYRGVFDPEAVCFEDAAPDFAGEFRRKRRIVNRSMRAVLKVPGAMNPFRVGWFAVQLIAHKVLRWLCPLFLVTMLISSAVLSFQEVNDRSLGWTYSVLLLLQLLGYAIACLHIFPPFRRIRLVYIAYYFLMVNIASARGLAMLAGGRAIGVWKPER
ncbi:Poly-beta-1,6-N-acetyl-D-glucosamine synthase [Rubripirellula tenax]|uniref:Poly-beta-1,6-N-acetyl-D-glucosamine synthase n=1 Tax=Rubripirellula tenax TaxID=2528015 RepID=A0A5C6F372_9BACT|nr:glycosyltransferase family 2 protein [Rubripirellula tenax]TWU54496.1 Poly-beta-1,6-N-acetyl-D-glucosamine synthase [Rubripirellula tenax]